jgi:hypothetical protein
MPLRLSETNSDSQTVDSLGPSDHLAGPPLRCCTQKTSTDVQVSRNRADNVGAGALIPGHAPAFGVVNYTELKPLHRRFQRERSGLQLPWQAGRPE